MPRIITGAKNLIRNPDYKNYWNYGRETINKLILSATTTTSNNQNISPSFTEYISMYFKPTKI